MGHNRSGGGPLNRNRRFGCAGGALALPRDIGRQHKPNCRGSHAFAAPGAVAFAISFSASGPKSSAPETREAVEARVLRKQSDRCIPEREKAQVKIARV